MEARVAADPKSVIRLTATDASFATGTITVDTATATDAVGNAVVKSTY